MCKVPVKLKEMVKQRLDAAAEEIFELLERTITEYEEEAERHRRLMETLLQPRVLLNTTAISGLLSVQPAEGSPSQPQDPQPPQIKEDPSPTHIKEEEDPPPPHIKEEQEEASSSQEALYRDIIMSQLWKREDTAPPSDFDEILITSQVPMKSEEEEAPETQPDQHNQTVACPEPPVPVAASGDRRSVTKKSNKRQRKNRNLVKSHVCPNCDKVFQWKSMLEKHMRVHTGERPFSCSVCGKKFSHKRSLESHLSLHSEIRQFICSVCGKRFAQKSGLKSHVVLHSGEKPFSCSVCGKRFAQKGNIEQHMMIHSGLKPYTCTVCGKAFSRKSNLQSHLPVHSREKHFKCSVCGKQYRQRSTLSRHMSTHR